MGAAIAWFSICGNTVALPLTDSQSYDLVVDVGKGLKRVQVKTTGHLDRGEGTPYSVQLCTKGGNKSSSKVKKFCKEDSDYLFILTKAGDLYFIPTEIIKAEFTLSLSSKYDEYKVPVVTGW